MRKILWLGRIMMVLFFLGICPAAVTAKKLPIVDGKEVVATVNGEPITLAEFNSEIAKMHRGLAGESKAGKVDYAGVLHRMINIRLIEQEARNIGLDKMPEFKDAVKKYEKQTLLDMQLLDYTRDIKADDAAVNKLYKDSIREYKLKSVFFKDEKAAKKLEKKIQAGNDFDQLAAAAVKQSKSVRMEEGDYQRRAKFLPKIGRILAGFKVGSTSPVVPVSKEFVVFKVEDIRYPDDPKALARAKKIATNERKAKVVEEYGESLRKKYAKVNNKLLSQLDFETSVEDFQKLLKDKRVLAEVTGEEPITVAELAKELKEGFFHGVEEGIKRKRFNSKKMETFEGILKRRLMRREALNNGIDRMEVYKNAIQKFKRSALFDTYLRKMVIPGIHLKKEDMTDYYNRHIEDYQTPEMMKITAIAFGKKADAEAALKKLQKGSDFAWVSQTAGGQLDKDTKGLLHFQEDMLLTTTGLPEGVRKVVAGAHSGDYRLYESPDGYAYVLFLQDVVPSKARPIEKVWKEIKSKVVKKKISQELEAQCRKLEKYYPVKIYEKGLKKQTN
jgi:hypothetical protein